MFKFKTILSKLINYIIFFNLPLLLLACFNQNKTSIKENEYKKPVALTTFTVLADIAQNIAGERILVKSITKPGAEIHSYQFTPSDLIKAKGASLIIENGLGLELWIQKFTASAGDIPRVVLSDGMKPLFISGDVYEGKPNPHAWMSPKRSIHYVEKIKDAFIKIDPEGIEVFSANAKLYKNKLLQLDQELRSHIASIPKEKRVLVTCEGAFTYLTDDYGMEEAYLWPVNSESQVTPRRMAKLITFIKEKKVPTIFCETTVSAKAQQEVAKASGATFGGNFFVDSLSNADGPATTLLDLQRYNLHLIRKGLTPKLDAE